MTGPAKEEAHGEVRKFGTIGSELVKLREWLQAEGAGSQERNRVQKVLEDANVKTGDVLNDVFGLSGQSMLEALVEGGSSTAEIAQLAQGAARKKISELEAALDGHRMRAPHRKLIRHAMAHMAFLAQQVESIDRDILEPIQESELKQAHELLQTIPGIQTTAAATILAESGPDRTPFPRPENFSSWSGVAPGNNESAGVKKRAPALRGNPHRKVALVESGWAACRTRESEFKERYDRMKPRLGHKRSLVACAHLLAVRIYEILPSKEPYRPSRPEFKTRDIQRLRRHHSRRLKTLDRWLKLQPGQA